MAKVRNFLFIMCDQLRHDYLSCYGHPTLETPNIDAVAARGVQFNNAYCQSPVCGAARMSAYTGRYMVSHGSTWNNVPLAVGEFTMGDYLRGAGVRTALVGKTHHVADAEGMARLAVDPVSEVGVLVSQCGFEPYDRDDGLHPDQKVNPNLAYNNYLRAKGYEAENPWHTFANSVEDENGEVQSGWHMRNSHLPARVKEEDSETAYMTRQAMAFIDECQDDSWCLHLSYIKPHWPYIVPAPYHNMYGHNDLLPVVRSQAERDDPHPVHAAFMSHEDSQSFSQDHIREHVIPAYMGLIKQIDDHIGHLMGFLEKNGRLDDTMIVFTSDHGDYLGDHWLGEKDLFHEPSSKVPMIVVDPDDAANATRGMKRDELVEHIDLLPTFLDSLGAEAQTHRLEGLSLLPLLHDPAPQTWRDAAFSEAEFAVRSARLELGLEPHECRAFMVRTAEWKYIFYEKYRPQLFDMLNDADELHDLGESADHVEISAQLHERLFKWLRTRPIRGTLSEKAISQRTGKSKQAGYLIGVW
jgi:arylsulfatase A-like enzyme